MNKLKKQILNKGMITAEELLLCWAGNNGLTSIAFRDEDTKELLAHFDDFKQWITTYEGDFNKWIVVKWIQQGELVLWLRKC